MPSTLPLVLGVLVFTGLVSALWRLARALMSRGKSPAASTGEATALRIDAARELLWTILLLAQFVFIEVLSESREVPQALAIAGSAAGGLCLIAAVVALASCVAMERSLTSGR
jgi:predicted component of type VI protein secretion system